MKLPERPRVFRKNRRRADLHGRLYRQPYSLPGMRAGCWHRHVSYTHLGVDTLVFEVDQNGDYDFFVWDRCGNLLKYTVLVDSFAAPVQPKPALSEPEEPKPEPEPESKPDPEMEGVEQQFKLGIFATSPLCPPKKAYLLFALTHCF